jgi:hypothetical protein
VCFARDFFCVDLLSGDAPKENEPKERAPCHSVLWTYLCFSKGPALEETRFAQTVHERHPDLSAMLDLVTTGVEKDFAVSMVITRYPRGASWGSLLCRRRLTGLRQTLLVSKQ